MDRRRRPRAATIIIAGLVLALALGGTATAARLITSKDIKNGTIKTADLSAAAKRALKGQKGNTGAQGAQGAPGPQGPAGAQGPSGAASLSELTEYAASGTVPAGEVFPGAIDCPDGERAISGGYWLGEGSENAVVYGDVATDGRTGWIVAVDNSAPAATTPAEVTAYVYCAAAGEGVGALRGAKAPSYERLTGGSEREAGLLKRR